MYETLTRSSADCLLFDGTLSTANAIKITVCYLFFTTHLLSGIQAKESLSNSCLFILPGSTMFEEQRGGECVSVVTKGVFSKLVLTQIFDLKSCIDLWAK